MTRHCRISVLALLSVLAAAQLVQPETRNPEVNPARRLWNDRGLDPRVATIAQRACGNCHSYETKWPWYSKFSPVSWFLVRHVEQGRAKLNFDEWSPAAAADQLEETYDSVAKNKMPPWSYLLMHPEARLSQVDRDLLLAWAEGKPGSAISK
jgi:cytochrome c551/c552